MRQLMKDFGQTDQRIENIFSVQTILIEFVFFTESDNRVQRNILKFFRVRKKHRDDLWTAETLSDVTLLSFYVTT